MVAQRIYHRAHDQKVVGLCPAAVNTVLKHVILSVCTILKPASNTIRPCAQNLPMLLIWRPTWARVSKCSQNRIKDSDGKHGKTTKHISSSDVKVISSSSDCVSKPEGAKHRTTQNNLVLG